MASLRKCRPRRDSPSLARLEVAKNLHSAALRLLRRLRRVDVELGVSTARLSVLSVLVFGGPATVSELARIEQVRQPTMSHLLAALERERLVVLRVDPDDARKKLVSATRKGRSILERGRRRRVETLAASLEGLADRDVATLRRAAALMNRLG